MKFALGTAQLGLDYGINNKQGRPLKNQSIAILEKAWSTGIRFFDTSPAYGKAEEILGEFISAHNLQGEIAVVSKFFSSDSEAVENKIQDTLKKLNSDSLDGYLLHKAEDMYNPETMEALKSCQQKGLVKNIGVSVYKASDARHAASSGIMNYIQIPYSVFDQRLDKTDFFTQARENNVKVFARSVFLQGLMLMKDQEIPVHLSGVKKHLLEFDEIINKYNLTREQAALLFVYASKNIDYAVFGADTAEQIDNNVRIVEETKDYEECLKELENRFNNINEYIISPNMWK